jgi:hypothetical protein
MNGKAKSVPLRSVDLFMPNYLQAVEFDIYFGCFRGRGRPPSKPYGRNARTQYIDDHLERVHISPGLEGSATANYAHQNHYHGEHQKNMDEAAQCVRRHQPQEPKHEQYDDYSFQHSALQVDVPWDRFIRIDGTFIRSLGHSDDEMRLNP